MNVRPDPRYIWSRHQELAEVPSGTRSAILRLAQLDAPPVILEGSAAVIWQLIEDSTTLDDLTRAVGTAFGTPVDDVSDLVATFVDELTTAGLLTRSVHASLTVSALGSLITVVVVGAHGVLLVDALHEAWSSCLIDLDPESPVIVVAAALDDPSHLDDLLQWVTQEVTIRAIEALAGQSLLFHACAVASPETGEAVVLVGPSGMGKTTLATVLGRRWGYVTDETAAIDTGTHLLAYPKPLSIIENADAPKAQRSPHSLGLLPVPADLNVVAIVLLDRRKDDPTGSGEIDVETVPTVDAIAMLAEHTSYLAQIDQPLRRMAELLNRTGGLRRVRYSASEDLMAVVAELLGESL
jgi:hypothetical protein